MLKTKKCLNSKGEFEPFRLLIGAVIGLVMLVIVLGIVDLVSNSEWQLSQQRFFDGFGTALKTPNGDAVLQQKLKFKRGTQFSASALIRNTELQAAECVQFETNTNLVDLPNAQLANVANNAQTDVFFCCQLRQNAAIQKCRNPPEPTGTPQPDLSYPTGTCNTSCFVLFGRP